MKYYYVRYSSHNHYVILEVYRTDDSRFIDETDAKGYLLVDVGALAGMYRLADEIHNYTGELHDDVDIGFEVMPEPKQRIRGRIIR